MDVRERPLPDRVLTLELQMARFVSDMESEKGTRSRANVDINLKLDDIREQQNRTNRLVYMMLGGVMVLQVAIQFFVHK